MKGQSEAKVYKNRPIDDKLIGKTFNKIKILELSKVVKSRRFYKVKCLNCGEITEMRSDRFTGTQKLSTCSKCRQSHAIQKSIERINPETVINGLYAQYRSNAQIRNIEFKLNKTEFKYIISMRCFYCGEEPKETGTSKHINNSDIIVKNNGIDRIDNSKGYTSNNVVACCSKCNMMKKNLNVFEFIHHINKIHNNFYKQSSTTISKESTLQVIGDGKGEHPKKDEDIV